MYSVMESLRPERGGQGGPSHEPGPAQAPGGDLRRHVRGSQGLFVGPATEQQRIDGREKSE